MATRWTVDQQKAIDQRETNILISAAAGSGKTAVLVERILSIVTDPVHPVDVDRLLIVTFTRAAAAEMKDRLGKALEARLSEEPDNEHLQKQGILLHHAQINTIHGFCTYVLQNYFHRIGLDPGYRIADDGELTMMKREVLGELLEEEYEKKEEDFLTFIESFAPGKSDRAAEELILRLYEFSISHPSPEEWLDQCVSLYEIDSEEELEKSQWLQNGMEEGLEMLRDIRARMKYNLDLAASDGGPLPYVPALQSDLEQVDGILSVGSYRGLVDAFSAFSPMRLARMTAKNSAGVNPELKDQVQAVRGELTKKVKAVGEQYFSLQPAGILEELKNCRVNAAELVRLTRRFTEGFDQRKRRGNILDFSDLEHFALQILLEKDEKSGEWKRSAAACELAGQFHEIMIDEYQDSNFVQEALLKAVSGEEDGRFNRFMVGDIKQSVYGFRQAKPELFLEKYNTYGEKDGCTRIDLKQNFRSRDEVLATVNAFFRRMMVPSLGGISYDDAAALHLGASYPETPVGDCQTEVILIDKKTPELEDASTKEDFLEQEAMAVALRIKELMRTQMVYDRGMDGFRPAQYRDFAILLRSFTKRAEVFLRVLKNEGIPAFAISKTGYFSTIEVVTVLNYLRLCDNPRQDIPYAAVLRSPIVGLTDEELALVHCAMPDRPLYEAVPMLVAASGTADGAVSDGAVSAAAGAAIAETSDSKDKNRISATDLKTLPEDLIARLQHFLDMLEGFRELVPCIPVHELVTRVLEGTGYRNIAASLPMGEQRLANLKLLVEQAVDFEESNYHGLFHFIRSIEQMEKNQVDFGEVNLYGETADAVGIMTIHKSKGLEYPFVFVSCLGDKFSLLDETASVVFHSELGLGMNYVNLDERVRHGTMIKKMVSNRIHLEMLSEELRVLYVALTRAKEKLILTALVDNLEKRVMDCVQTPPLADEPLPFGRLAAARGYLDWILPILSQTEGFRPVYEIFRGEEHPAACIDAPVRVMVQTPGAMTIDKLEESLGKRELHRMLQEVGENPEVVYDATVRAFLEKKTAWEYTFDYRNSLPSVMSVSELKKHRPSASDEETFLDESEFVVERPVELYEPEVDGSEEEALYLPAFMREKEEVKTGAVRGTAYHRFFECLDYGRMPEDDTVSLYPFVEEQILEMVSCGKLEQAEADCLFRKDLVVFLESSVGQRMRSAAARGDLLREQPFLMNLPSGEINPEWDYDETILIRGVIDACFVEDGAYVIVDYKTDKVYSGDGSCLLEKYAKQLRYYQKALEKGMNLPVKERLIYSVRLGKEVPVPAADF